MPIPIENALSAEYLARLADNRKRHLRKQVRRSRAQFERGYETLRKAERLNGKWFSPWEAVAFIRRVIEEDNREAFFREREAEAS